MKNLLPLDDALALIGTIVAPIRAHEEVRLEDALHRVTAAPLHAPYALPPFDNTGVDGYAYRHADLHHEKLQLVGSSFAGEGFGGTLPAGSAVHIATGAPLPHGADTVSMQEHCHVENDQVMVTQKPSHGANIRRKGNDIAAKAEAIPAGRHLTAGDIALLGALGFTRVNVMRQVRIGIASTGNEIRPHGSKLEAGQIIDTNGLMLKQLLMPWSRHVSILGALPDDRAATDAYFKQMTASHDLIITTGGISVGQRDFVRDALQALGHIHFWKIAIRPGRPVMFGSIGACHMLALPGNPVSAFVTFYLIALPLLQALYGMKPQLPAAYPVTLGADIAPEPHLRCFPRARIERRSDKVVAMPYRDQSSNLISSLADTDGLLDLPANKDGYKAGDWVNFMPLRG